VRSSSPSATILVEAKGKHTVKTEAVGAQAYDYYKKLSVPGAGDPAWINTSNNKWMTPEQGALIMNPQAPGRSQSADAPSQVARQLWTNGIRPDSKGATRSSCPTCWGIWNFQQEQAGGQEHAWSICAAYSGEDGGGERRAMTCRSTASPNSRPGTRGRCAQAGTLDHYPNQNNQQILSARPRPAFRQRTRTANIQSGDPRPRCGAVQAGRADRGDAGRGRSEIEGFMRT